MSKNGFRLVYHKSISDKDKPIVEDFLLDFIEKTAKCNGSYAKAFRTNGGWVSHLRWKALGLPVNQSRGDNYCVNDKLILRRLSKNRRIFGVVPRDLVFSLNGFACSTQYKNCICLKCTMAWTSNKGFTMNEPFKDDNYVVFYDSGDIKG